MQQEYWWFRRKAHNQRLRGPDHLRWRMRLDVFERAPHHRHSHRGRWSGCDGLQDSNDLSAAEPFLLHLPAVLSPSNVGHNSRDAFWRHCLADTLTTTGIQLERTQVPDHHSHTFQGSTMHRAWRPRVPRGGLHDRLSKRPVLLFCDGLIRFDNCDSHWRASHLPLPDESSPIETSWRPGECNAAGRCKACAGHDGR